MRCFRASAAEIAADPALRAFGAVLAAVHLVGFAHWWIVDDALALLARGKAPLCWPFFERCGDFRVLDAGGWRALLALYAALALTALVSFARPRDAGLGLGLLLSADALRVGIVAQDFQLRLNQHYMSALVAVAFGLLPDKRRAVRWLVVAIYVWAGLLKLDREWLSGAALYGRPLGVPEALLPAACAYVVVLELVLVFGLFARRRWVFAATLAQLAAFHAASYRVVGFFYPLLMAGLLSIFVLARRFPRPGEPPMSLPRLFAGRERWTTSALLAGFSALQIVPWLFPGDTALTGEGRLFALHMFDAQVVCEGQTTLHDAASGRTRKERLDLPAPVRIRCDPITYLGVARRICARWAEKHGAPPVLDLSLRSRRASEPELRPVLDVKDICRSGIEYDLLRHNAWIVAE